MKTLAEQLRDYGRYLDRVDAPVAISEPEVASPRRLRLGAVAALVAVSISAGAALVALRASSDDDARIRRATIEQPTDRREPPPTVSPQDDAMFPGPEPTVAEQYARLRSWYANAAADAPGGEPILASEAVFCDYDGKRDQRGPFVFASDGRLDAPLTADDLVGACTRLRRETGGLGDNAVPGPGTACVGKRRGPIYDATTSQAQGILKPVVIYGPGSCQDFEYQPMTQAFLDVVNARRALETKLRAVPRDCPSYEEAAAWTRKVTTEAGAPMGVAPLASANECVFRAYVDWDVNTVFWR